MERPTDKPPLPDLDLIFVEGGILTMGDNNSQFGWEKPEHEVKVSSFYIGKFQVTQQLWQAVMGSNPSYFKGEKRPVEQVSWLETQDFIGKLNGKKEVQDYLQSLDPAGATLRLPSEAEWEFAARGGIYSQGYDYCGSDKLKQVGWYDENSNIETHDVGLLLANELGLYDMSGNVWEWCEDDFYENHKGAPKVGSAWIDSPKRGDGRVLRGGSCFSYAGDCRPTGRYGNSPDFRDYSYCFRLTLSLPSAG